LVSHAGSPVSFRCWELKHSHGGKTFVFVILSPVDLVKSTDVKPDVIDFVRARVEWNTGIRDVELQIKGSLFAAAVIMTILNIVIDGLFVNRINIFEVSSVKKIEIDTVLSCSGHEMLTTSISGKLKYGTVGSTTQVDCLLSVIVYPQCHEYAFVRSF